MKYRCQWVTENLLYLDYHDNEWGVPVFDDKKLFECLVLESFQSGLSWLTILKKRAHFREAFDQFDYVKVSTYEDSKVNILLQNDGIVRHRLKIEATIQNAKQFIKIRDEFGSFSNYIWEFVGHKPIKNTFDNHKHIPAKTELSDRIAKDLKKRGFKFVGSTTVYAFLQAIGIVNDHETHCFRYHQV